MKNTNIINAKTTYNGVEGLRLTFTNNTNITSIIATFNGDRTYGGLRLSGQVAIYFSTHILIYNTSFTSIRTLKTINSEELSLLSAVFYIHTSTVHISECYFTRNHISAIRGEASNVTLSGWLK